MAKYKVKLCQAEPSLTSSYSLIKAPQKSANFSGRNMKKAICLKWYYYCENSPKRGKPQLDRKKCKVVLIWKCKSKEL